MSTKELFCDLIYDQQAHSAERELSAFPPLSMTRDWRAVTIAASARLANRLSTAPHQAVALVASADTKV